MIPVPETNFEQPNAGIFLATVIDVEDLGEVASKNPAFPQSKHRVKIVWVLNANDSKGRPYTIAFECPEFTCLCPLTGQPDFAHFTIQYVPKARCVELKSLKLYLWSYRNEGAFHEAVTNKILDDLVKAVKPRQMSIEADFFVRGWIHTVIAANYSKKKK